MRAASGSGAFARFSSAVTPGLTVVLVGGLTNVLFVVLSAGLPAVPSAGAAAGAVPGAPCGSGGASMGVNKIDSVRVSVELIMGQYLSSQRTSNSPGFVLHSPLFSRSE